ncbi:unnamed protein product [Alopecurus aequalis]
MRIMSSGASTAASTLRSAGASLVNSIASHDDDASRDQVQWAGFDKLECGGDVLRQVLLLAYRSGFQVWDVEQADDVRQLESRHDGAVTFMQLLKKPIASKKGEDRFVDVRPLLAIAGGGTSTGSANSNDANGPVFNGTNGTHHNIGGEKLPTILRFFSLKDHGYVHSMKFRSAVYSIRCSPRVVAVSQATQIHCFDAATLELEYTLLTSPIVSPVSGYGPLGLGPRWIAYSGNPVPVPNTGRVTPQLLGLSPLVPPPGSNGSVVAYYAKESSKQLAAGIVTLSDVGYKKLSRYYSDLIPNGNGTMKQGNSGFKANGVTNGHTIDSEYAGMVIVRDIVSKAMIVQFRAHTSPISVLCFDPSGTLLVTASIHGRNINVFRIIPSSDGSASEDGPNGTSVHLYKLQRGITNAVIKDISFSDDSEWILISSSRGTSHFFAISPYSGSTSFHYSDSNLAENNYVVDSSVKHAAHWSQNGTSSLSLNQKMLSVSGPPVALSVVSRIRNGSNLLKGAVHGAAAFATGVSSPISGAIASTFHNCKGAGHSDGGPLSMKYYLLVFSPSGSIIQYVLHHSAEQDSVIDFPSDAVSYGSQRETDTKFVIEALQKWDVCQKRNRRDTAESNLYNDYDSGENNKLFQKVVRKGNSIYPSNSAAVERLKLSADEKHNYYISESELQTHVVQIPVWSRSGVHFQVIGGGTLEADTDDISGETEIEKVWTRNIESRSKNLIPVFESLHTSRYQQTRVNTPDSNRSGFLQRQKSGFSADGRLSRRSSSSSLDCMSEVPNSADDNSFGQYLVEDSSAAVNKNSILNRQAELVNNTESLNTEAQLGVVNSKEDVVDRELLPDL